MTGKINIYYIEDNPKPEDTLIKDLEYHFPDEDLFNLFIFQHPNDLYEYLKSVGKLNKQLLAESCPESIPSIVIFDYQMSDNLSFEDPGSFVYSKPNHLKYLKSKNISLLLKDKFEEELKQISLMIEEPVFNQETYKKYYDFSKDYFLDFKQNKGNDEFGLFMGVSLLKEFEITPIFCQPSTRAKSNKDDLSKAAKFYEWINSVNIGKSVGENITSKKWEDLMPAALLGLRERIKSQIKNRVISPNYSILKEFVSDDFKLSQDTVLEFTTGYGKIEMNLNALFYDKQGASQTNAINSWSEELLENINTKTFDKAKEISETLINAYRGENLIRQRDKLSLLILRSENDTLSESETKELESLFNIFGINNSTIKNYFDKKKKNNEITKNIIDFREYAEMDVALKRLIVLFTDIRLHKLWSNYIKNNSESKIETDILEKYFERPISKDLEYALFPIPKNPLVLFHHQDLANDDVKKKIPNIKNKDTFVKTFKDYFGDVNYQNNSPFFKNISSKEQSFCASFSLEVELSKEHWPNYLKH